MKINLQSTLSFGDNQSLRVFFGDHAFAHATYERLIAGAGGTVANYFDVSDQSAVDAWTKMNEEIASSQDHKSEMPHELMNWLIMHNDLHGSESNALGIPQLGGLTTVDFSKRDQFYDWLNSHQQQHDAQDAALGI